MIDDPHTTLIILQLHMSIMQKANHLCGYPMARAGQLFVLHLIPTPVFGVDSTPWMGEWVGGWDGAI